MARLLLRDEYGDVSEVLTLRGDPGGWEKIEDGFMHDEYYSSRHFELPHPYKELKFIFSMPLCADTSILKVDIGMDGYAVMTSDDEKNAVHVITCTKEGIYKVERVLQEYYASENERVPEDVTVSMMYNSSDSYGSDYQPRLVTEYNITVMPDSTKTKIPAGMDWVVYGRM